jgi:hypothetical protein
MKTSWLVRAIPAAAAVLMFGWFGAVEAGDLNPAAIRITPPKDITWNSPGGTPAT